MNSAFVLYGELWKSRRIEEAQVSVRTLITRKPVAVMQKRRKVLRESKQAIKQEKTKTKTKTKRQNKTKQKQQQQQQANKQIQNEHLKQDSLVSGQS